MLLQKTKTCLKIIAENDFNHTAAESLQQQLIKALQNSTKKEVFLEFGADDVLDDAGLKLLIGLYRECVQKDLKLTLKLENETILETIRICGLDQLIEVKES